MSLPDDFGSFLEGLGYRVYLDGRRSTGERWYELCDADGLALQISIPPPSIEALRTDLPRFIAGEQQTDSAANHWADYWIACESTDKLRDLLQRMQAA